MTVARALGLLSALGLAACAVAPGGAAAPAPDLAGTRWVGVVEEPADARTLPRLEFVATGRVSGYTGCNMLSGSWRVADGEVRIGPLVTTKRLCLGPAGEVEKRFLRALGEGGRGAREEGKLVFTGPGGARFEFVPAASS